MKKFKKFLLPAMFLMTCWMIAATIVYGQIEFHALDGMMMAIIPLVCCLN